MDGGKLEISGKPTKESPTATYKQVPESDLEEEAALRSKSAPKHKVNNPEKDGADEKMLPDEETKVAENSNVNAADVKFISSNEKQNGDAKVDIGELKTAFVGMSKEELMKYANDPFWVRLRWILFISFWLVWAAMLVGAILIIVAAPKCSPPEPRTWWEQGPLTEVEPDVTTEELHSLKDQGVQGVIVTWPDDAYVPLNESESFVNFLHKAKTTDTNVIIDLKPGLSHNWFTRSAIEGDNGNFSDYYIWASAKGFNGSNTPIEPNNWVSKTNKKAWKYSETRKKFYYSPDDTPLLNFYNHKVINEFTTVLQNFLEAGVKGVRLTGIPYLLYDRNLADDSISPSSGDFSINDYALYTHTTTEYREELGSLINKWRFIVKNKTENGPLLLSESVIKYLDKFKVNNTLMIDLPSKHGIFGGNKNLTASKISANLNLTFLLLENKYWPLWQENTTALPADVLNIVTLLLPGCTLIDRNTNVSQELLNMRKSSSIMYGNTTIHLVSNNTIFAFGRWSPGNPGYLVMLNPTSHRITVDFIKEIPTISEELTVQYFSKNYNETDVEVKKKIDATNVPLSPVSALVLSYVPKSN